jgi:hypothetical protein
VCSTALARAACAASPLRGRKHALRESCQVRAQRHALDRGNLGHSVPCFGDAAAGRRTGGDYSAAMSSPMTFARDRFASLLGNAVAAGAFSARRTASPDDLRLEVRGVGPIALPVSVRQAKELCLMGRPARFGKGEQTLLDAKVRDTWEIPKSRVKIDKRPWGATLRPVLDRLRADLGLPAGCELTAELHSMLVYAPGQFFAPHQDSEKADAMIGTLVVTLPSASKGGVLVVEWPLAEQSRRHVHNRIGEAELPVHHQTRRSGRPYTLVLRKTDALFEGEREARLRDQADVAWLGRTVVAR